MVTKDFCNTDVADEQGQPSGVYVTAVSDVMGSERLESLLSWQDATLRNLWC